MLYKNGRRYHRRVHRLIAETLIPNDDINKTFIDHLDGNKLNNNVSNLEWVTNQENTQRGYNNNLYHSKKRCIKVKVTDLNGIITTYNSIRTCSESLGINRKKLSRILFDNKVNNTGYIFEVET